MGNKPLLKFYVLRSVDDLEEHGGAILKGYSYDL